MAGHQYNGIERMPHQPSCRFLAGTIIALCASPSAAQGIGLQGGGTANPDQFYVGSHIEFVLGSDRFVIRPNIEGGTGDGLTTASINFEFLYRYVFPGSSWGIYQGTGPAVNLYRFSDMTDVQGGLNVVFGVRHESGFFSELKVGSSGSPDLKYGVGFSVRTTRASP